MKSKLNSFKEAVCNAKDMLSLIMSVITFGGIIVTVIITWHTKNEKLNDTISKKEFIQVMNEIKNKIDDQSDSLKSIKEDMSTIASSLIVHIRNQEGMSSEEKLNTILDLVRDLSTDVKKNLSETVLQSQSINTNQR